MTKKQKKRCQELTADFHWPSRAFPKDKPDWDNIAYELVKISEDELLLRNNPSRAVEAVNLAGLCFMEQGKYCLPTYYRMVNRLINHAASTKLAE
jgi:hypothetical protein